MTNKRITQKNIFDKPASLWKKKMLDNSLQLTTIPENSPLLEKIKPIEKMIYNASVIDTMIKKKIQSRTQNKHAI